MHREGLVRANTCLGPHYRLLANWVILSKDGLVIGVELLLWVRAHPSEVRLGEVSSELAHRLGKLLLVSHVLLLLSLMIHLLLLEMMLFSKVILMKELLLLRVLVLFLKELLLLPHTICEIVEALRPP